MADTLAKVEAEISELRDQIKQLVGKEDELSKQLGLVLQQQLLALRQKELLLMQLQAGGGRSTGDMPEIAPPQDDFNTLLADLEAIKHQLAPFQAAMQPVQRWHTRVFNTAKDTKKVL